MAALTALPPSDVQNMASIAVPLSPATTANIIHGRDEHMPMHHVHGASAVVSVIEHAAPDPIVSSQIQPGSPDKQVFKMRGQLAGSFN